MKLLFGAIGAVLGCMLGGLPHALSLALLGAVAGWRWSGRPAPSKPATSELDMPTLLRRVVSLERELGTLREAVAGLRAEAAPVQAKNAVAAAPAFTPASAPVVASAEARPMAKPHPAVAASAKPAAAAPRVPLRDRLPPAVARPLFGGNAIVKLGVLILFLGLAFLLRYTTERMTLPPELRYAGVALVGIVLTAIGWRLRDRRDVAGGAGYGLILQGAGIGVFYLTALAALRLDPLLSPGVAFAFMALVAVSGAVLAVLQDAPWLAFVSIAEGFAAPVLVSTGSDAWVPLMSYMAILDAGILALAWFKAWRPLNLVGAVATFALAGAWAHAHYTVADYAGVQACLVFFFLLFTLTGVLFARRALAAGDAPPPGRPLADRAADALRQVGRVDSTLSFGVPLAAFSLQYLLVRDLAWGPAWAAAAFALFHILLGGALMRGQARYALLGEAHVIVGTIFATLAIPLALQDVWTGATWAIEAAGMYWLGARQRRTYARAFALLVMAGATARLLGGLSLDLRDGAPLIAGSALGMAMLAAALCAMDIVRRRSADPRGGVEQIAAVTLPFAGASGLAGLAWMLCPVPWAAAATAWIAYGCAALSDRLAAPSLRLASVLMHLGALTALTLSLPGADTAPVQAHAWRDLAAALTIGVALLATGGLGVRDAWREPRPISLGNSIGLVSGLAVASASLLFELAPAEAALAWPVIGLAAASIGLRLRSGALVGSGIALQVAAGLASVVFQRSVWATAEPAAAIPSTLWISLLLTLAGLALGDRMRATSHGETARAWWQAGFAQWALVAWASLWWSRALPPVVWRALESRHAPDALDAWPHWQVLWLTLSASAAVVIARWRDWRVLGQATLVAVPLWIALALAEPRGIFPSAHLGWLAWPLALLAHPWLARMQARWRPAMLAAPLQLAGGWLFVALATRECVLRVQAVAAPGSAWTDLAAMAVPALVLLASTPSTLPGRRQDDTRRDTWRVAGCGALALYLFAWLWAGNTGAGDAAPLPWLPLLNPLEIGQGIALFALAGWVRALPAPARGRVAPAAATALAGVTALGLVTGLVLRACHHWAGVPWAADALFASTLAQSALSVTWSSIGVALMVAAHRRMRRAAWLGGAALLGVVVAKLFLVELADRGSLDRIVSFIVVGGLMLAVGYFAPIPPRRDDDPAHPGALGEAA